ncbi:L-amino-acid oxidase [Fusarium oxysporum f. sp. albedinis]|nr:L-amino-acid oxidase [Fusarium oxysporum f. sp. albedinis]
MIKETVAAGRLLSLSGGLDVELKWMSLNSPLIVPRCRYNTLQVDAYLRSTIDPYSYISTSQKQTRFIIIPKCASIFAWAMFMLDGKMLPPKELLNVTANCRLPSRSMPRYNAKMD